ncbi:Ionotropic receptor 127 [Frankliniella occidentalis]|nr:Ionotropic receptor 127 [Frankliniella occidentalis]
MLFRECRQCCRWAVRSRTRVKEWTAGRPDRKVAEMLKAFKASTRSSANASNPIIKSQRKRLLQASPSLTGQSWYGQASAMKLLVILAHLACLGSHHEAALPPLKPVVDTRGMPDLVSSLLLPIHGSLFVYGRSRALDAFLEQLNPEVPRTMAPLVTDLYGGIRRVLHLQQTDSIILVVDERGLDRAYSLIDHDIPEASRVLLWTWADSVQDVLPLNITSAWLTGIDAALAVSTPNGTTVLFNVSVDSNRLLQLVIVTEIDTWSPLTRRWQRRGPPFKRMCQKWKHSHKAGKRAPLGVNALIPDHHVVYKQAFHEFVTGLVNSIRPKSNLRWSNVTELKSRCKDCTLSAALLFQSHIMRPPGPVHYADFRMANVLVMVPAGLDPHATLLQAVTDEFSAELWCATAGAVLAVAVATALAAMAILRRPPPVALADAPLQALAPLLAQAPSGRTAHRPLSAVWLLMSVVLAAAYQGLLLRELTAPPGEINNLEHLEQSGLTVRVSNKLCTLVPALLSNKLQSRMSYFDPSEISSALRSVADSRNSAVVLLADASTSLALAPYEKPAPKRLHRFKIGGTLPAAHMMYSAGSPLRESLGLAAERVRSHGLTMHLVRTMALHQARDTRPGEDEQITKPLSLLQLQPAFLLLAYCQCLATLVFVLELLCQKWCNKRAQSSCGNKYLPYENRGRPESKGVN